MESFLELLEVDNVFGIFLCACGKEVRLPLANVRRGHNKSCGCRKNYGNRKKHGATAGGYTKTYNSWRGMRHRCLNPNASRWKDYGGRGITVCERWDLFENFLADMGERPVGTTLERRDNDLGYSPDNCVWATLSEQAQNRRSTQ